MKSRQVGVKPILRFKVNVERHKIEEWKMKVFGRGIIHISDETVRILCFHRPIQALEIAFDLPAAQPPNHRCRDFIAKGVAKQSGMRGAHTYSTPDQLFDIRGAFPVDEITCVLFGRKSNHDPKTMPLSHVEKLAWWRCMWNTDGIQSIGSHQRKILV